MDQITKRQHIVPSFYLKQWQRNGTTNIVSHDLEKLISFDVSPDGILVRRFFYEETPASPDNRVENLLASMEGECSKHFYNLNNIDLGSITFSNENEKLRLIREALTPEVCKAIKKFAAFQYLRIPGAIEQKRYELAPAELSQIEMEYLLNAGRFVDSGFSYIEKRFQSLKLMILVSKGQDFITSDWPCFDMKDAEYSPILGEEIGVSSDVVAYFPLNPRLGVILYPPDYGSSSSGSYMVPDVLVIPCVDSVVRNQNNLIIQQADRFVIANHTRDFIFKVSTKRKKSKKL